MAPVISNLEPVFKPQNGKLAQGRAAEAGLGWLRGRMMFEQLLPMRALPRQVVQPMHEKRSI